MLLGLAVVAVEEAREAAAAISDAEAVVCRASSVAVLAVQVGSPQACPPIRIATLVERVHRVSRAAVPLRWGETWPDEVQAAEAAMRQDAAWALALRAVRDCCEVTLRYRPQPVSAEVRHAGTGGRAFLEARRAAHAVAQGYDQREFDDAAAALAPLVGLAKDAVMERSGGAMPFPGVTLLVPRERVPDLLSRAKVLVQGSRWAVTGPWPLWTFGPVAHARAVRVLAKDAALAKS